MNVSLLILDGLLVIIFLVGWVAATGFSAYKWNWWRFLRALSVPLSIGVTLHFIVNGSWWQNPSPALLKFVEDNTMLIVSIGSVAWIAFIIFAPILAINLSGFVVAQFTGSSKFFTLPLGDGDIVFAIPAPDNESEKTDTPATKAEYEEWLHKQ